MSAAKHTPTPWAVNPDDQITIYDLKSQVGIACCESELMVSAPARVRRANAEFIVRAANSHDALVKALMQSQEKLTAYYKATNGNYPGGALYSELIKTITAALSLAGAAQ